MDLASTSVPQPSQRSCAVSPAKTSLVGIGSLVQLPFLFFLVPHLSQATPAIKETFIFHHIGEQFPRALAPVALEQDALGISVQFQHKSSSILLPEGNNLRRGVGVERAWVVVAG